MVAAMGALLFVSTGESRASGGDRERVTRLIATFTTATTTSASSVIFTELWSSALDDSVGAVRWMCYRNSLRSRTCWRRYHGYVIGCHCVTIESRSWTEDSFRWHGQ